MQVFNARLAKIEDYCDPVLNRVKEMKARPAAIAGKHVKLCVKHVRIKVNILLSLAKLLQLVRRTVCVSNRCVASVHTTKI